MQNTALRKCGAHIVISPEKSRGAILVESAIILCFLMGLLFAGIQIGTVSYYQLALDQAAETQARMTALTETAAGLTNGQAAAVNANLQQALPNLSTAKVSLGMPTVMSTYIPTAQYGVYDYTDQNARTGGSTVVAPLQQISSVKTQANVVAFLLTPISLSASAIEATQSSFCPHYCLIPGGVGNASVSGDAVNYFTQGDNTTPYYMGFHYMVTCATNGNWDFTEWSEMIAGSTSWSVCFNASGTVLSPSLTWRALGSAEHLDGSNDHYQLPGETLDKGYWNSALPKPSTILPYDQYYQPGTYNAAKSPPITPPSDAQAGPFFEVWCHRNYYKWLDVYAISPLGPTHGPNRLAASYNSQDYLTRLYGYFGTEGGAHAGEPRPGQIMYGGLGGASTTPMGTVGWDSTNAGGGGAVNFNATLAPWWGCGVPQ